MLRDSPDDERADGYDPTKGWRIIGLSLACAVDALTAGVALSLMGSDTWELAPVFGATAAGMAFIGTRIGRHAGLRLGQWPQRVGGFVLIAIGIRGASTSFGHRRIQLATGQCFALFRKSSWV